MAIKFVTNVEDEFREVATEAVSLLSGGQTPFERFATRILFALYIQSTGPALTTEQREKIILDAAKTHEERLKEIFGEMTKA